MDETLEMAIEVTTGVLMILILFIQCCRKMRRERREDKVCRSHIEALDLDL